MSVQADRTTLITGATGFLGVYVLRDLLDRGHRIVALLRPPMDAARRRIEELLGAIGCDGKAAIARGRLLLVEGVLPGRLPEPTWGRTDRILHNAASLELFTNGDPQGDPFRTNVRGTRAILDWADAHNVREMFTVSTAYTCGWNDGLIAERFHDPQPAFQTDYEKTKWLAERFCQEWADRPERTLTVFRPSFLVGDSQTGFTTQFAGFYQFARLVGVLKERYRDSANGDRTYIPLRIPGRPGDVQNVVPVDYVARMIAEIVGEPRFHGRIYHLTNPDPPTNDLMKRCYEEFFSLYGGFFADPGDVVGKCTEAESLLWDQYHLLTPRVVHTPRFDTTNARRVHEAVGLHFPVLDRSRILMLLDWAARQNWGRSNGRK